MHINTFGEPEKRVTTPLGPYLTYSFRLILFCYLPLNSIMDGTSNVTEASYFNYDDPDMSGCGSWRSCPANFTCTVSRGLTKTVRGCSIGSHSAGNGSTQSHHSETCHAPFPSAVLPSEHCRQRGWLGQHGHGCADCAAVPGDHRVGGPRQAMETTCPGLFRLSCAACPALSPMY